MCILVLVVVLFCVLLASFDCSLKSRVRVFPFMQNDSVGTPLFLTPLIENGKIDEAQNMSKVTPDVGNTTSYSGYFTSNKKCGNNLFFWYFPALQDWKNAPIVLWLGGELGASSMFSLFEEVGPFNSFRGGLQLRNYSWNVKNNLVFIDQPVGTGYSFTEKGCYVRNETDIGEDLYSALVQFLMLFPSLQDNKFFLIGESYAAHYIPAIGYTIHTRNLLTQFKVNLKGMMIGGGWIDPVSQINYGDYLYQLGLVDDRQQQHFYFQQNMFVNQMDSHALSKAYKTWHVITDLIRNITRVSLYNYIPLRQEKSNWGVFIQLPFTRRAIHVGDMPFRAEPVTVRNHLKQDIMHSVKHQVEYLLDNDYPILFYAGQLDIVCGYPMLVNFLRSLNWSGQHLYLNATRDKWMEEGQIAGYVKGRHLLFDVLVRAAGHNVAIEQPFWTYQLLNSFTQEQRKDKEFISCIHHKS